MLNWCPIGRKATQAEREAWKKVDTEKGLREHYLELLRNEIATMEISVTAALGGSTSIDIYPEGWDKTYALQHFEGHTCWFVGDKCQPNGNDHLIFEAASAHGRGYVTKSPENTEKIIKDISKQITAAQDVDQEKES
jgi:phosphomannomutase